MFRKGKKKIGGVTLSKRMNEERGNNHQQQIEDEDPSSNIQRQTNKKRFKGVSTLESEQIKF